MGAAAWARTRPREPSSPGSARPWAAGFPPGAGASLSRPATPACASSVVRLNPFPLLVHIHSTMRMGTSESDSVVDANGAARAVDGLYVADNSSLANSCGGMNPTLTTQALATRTAERVFQSHF